VGLLARALELSGVATTLTTWNPGRTRPTAPPRATFTRLERGQTLGMPHDLAQQRRVLDATLVLLAKAAPTPIVRLDEKVAASD
jgi:hypothetical protein